MIHPNLIYYLYHIVSKLTSQDKIYLKELDAHLISKKSNEENVEDDYVEMVIKDDAHIPIYNLDTSSLKKIEKYLYDYLLDNITESMIRQRHVGCLMAFYRLLGEITNKDRVELENNTYLDEDENKQICLYDSSNSFPICFMEQDQLEEIIVSLSSILNTFESFKKCSNCERNLTKEESDICKECLEYKEDMEKQTDQEYYDRLYRQERDSDYNII